MELSSLERHFTSTRPCLETSVSRERPGSAAVPNLWLFMKSQCVLTSPRNHIRVLGPVPGTPRAPPGEVGSHGGHWCQHHHQLGAHRAWPPRTPGSAGVSAPPTTLYSGYGRRGRLGILGEGTASGVSEYSVLVETVSVSEANRSENSRL